MLKNLSNLRLIILSNAVILNKILTAFAFKVVIGNFG